MNNNSQHELDDELLSAYLDDELAPAERAAVESRLAADPAAQQTLEHLRNVSQAVHGLPKQSLGPDFQNAVLRRIEAAKPAPATIQMPGVSIGRTRRGWIWAATAVAAALMVAVLQTDDEQDAGAPNIASRNATPATVDERLADAPAQWREGGESSRLESSAGELAPAAAPPSESVANAPAQESLARAPARELGEATPSPEQLGASSSARGDVRFDSEPLAAATPPITAPAPQGAVTDGKVTDLSIATESDSLAQAPLSSSLSDDAADDDLIVVQVLTRQSAIQSKAFDRLLASNGVAVDAEAEDRSSEAEDRSGGRTEEVAEQDTLASGRYYAEANQPQQPAPPPNDVEAVLVEAPAATIVSCMQAIDSDRENYLGVLVDPAPAAEEEAAAPSKAAVSRKLATDLGKYNRGIPQLSDQDWYDGSKSKDKADRFSYQVPTDAAESETAQTVPFGGGRGGTQFGSQSQSQSGSLDLSANSERGRARRLKIPLAGMEHASSVTNGQQPSNATTASASPRPDAKLRWGVATKDLEELKRLSAAGDESLQVLFLLRIGDEPAASAPTPSAPAATRAE